MSNQSRSPYWRAACALILLVVGGGRVLHADEQTDFRNGVRAMDRGRWSEAVDAMRSAIAQKSTESATAVPISGNRNIAYMPHLYLAAALWHLNRCDEARQELAMSVAAGVSQRFEATTIRQVRDGCGPAPPPVLTASGPAATNTTTTTQPPVRLQPTETVADAGPGISTPTPVQPGTTATAVPAATTTVAQIDPNLETARRRLDSTLADARRALQTTPGTDAGRAARTRLGSAMPTATSALSSPSSVVITRAADSLNAALRDYRTAIGAASKDEQQVVEALRSYVIGDYGRAVNLLARPDTLTTYRAEAYLVRAASRFSLYALTAERDQGLRDLAIADVREYRKLKPSGGAVNRRYFSPRFERFVAQASP